MFQAVTQASDVNVRTHFEAQTPFTRNPFDFSHMFHRVPSPPALPRIAASVSCPRPNEAQLALCHHFICPENRAVGFNKIMAQRYSCTANRD